MPYAEMVNNKRVRGKMEKLMKGKRIMEKIKKIGLILILFVVLLVSILQAVPEILDPFMDPIWWGGSPPIV